MEAAMAIIGISPTVDIIFKLLFGNAQHPDLTRELLNAILPAAGRPRVTSIQLLNPFTLAEFQGDKEIVVDVRVRDETGCDYQIEMQVERQADLPRRILDNWSRLYDRQIGAGQEYTDHRPLVCLWILDEKIPDMPRWFDAVDMTRRSDGKPISRDFLVIALQLERWRALHGSTPVNRAKTLKSGPEDPMLGGEVPQELHALMRFLAESQEWDSTTQAAENDPGWIGEALNIMIAFTKEEAERDIYDRRIEAERVRKALIRRGLEEGREEGREAGLAEGIAIGEIKGIAIGETKGEARGVANTARRMKALGLPEDIIAAATGLSPAEVAEL
jgi:hypothetical protein